MFSCFPYCGMFGKSKQNPITGIYIEILVQFSIMNETVGQKNKIVNVAKMYCANEF